MRTVKIGCFYFNINLTMKVIDSFFSLGYQKLEVNKDLMRLLKLPNIKKLRIAVQQEVDKQAPYLSSLKEKCAEMGAMSSYYSSSPEDINLAYNGHIKLINNVGNLIIIAERKACDINATPFEIDGDHKADRAQTLKKFGLEDK